ncbi:MMPL family transporter [Pallidibacillus pasinlerensis]|uniref:MMPL family transporter n=1 Tax=Pallidibacillus pasinlerensis TaxID=2703818 RepID=A0ABX0A7B8_9BACI|nr:MMPL family transporter [Pallidibacillus pasinlerensis]NCU18135.1 MMPL family transporter [Pallidibacillus pasinlerensis]
MRAILKGKWFILIAWLVATVVLFITAPDMGPLVREKGQITVPDGYSSSKAQQLLNEINEQEDTGDTTSLALVFHNEKGLTAADFEEAEKAVKQLEEKKDELGITELLTHFNQSELEEQLVSEDGKTILVSLTVDWKDRTAKELSEDVYAAIDNINLEHYYTGAELIAEDVVVAAEEGVKKTEAITIVFILIVLIAVFRSVVTPFVPLLTVGISYLVSQSIVAYLVDNFNFPLSNFTQIFLVAVLFGIGTDYSILLMNRYKEELAQQETITEAIIETFRHAGKTVFYSGIAVFIGFAVIGLSQFSLYQSAVAVAVGIAVLMLALFTIVPFFMSVLGKYLFWPSNQAIGHKPNKLWNMAGNFSFARPVLSIVIVAIITIPFIITYNGNLSYDSMNEIGDSYNTVKGYNIIEDSFGPGEAMPTTIVMKNDEKMDDTEYLTLIEAISQELEKVDGVDKVRSLTRPTGEKLEDLQVAKQVETLKDGINEGNEGIKQIRDGLDEASKKISESAPQLTEATDGIQSLIDGTSELQSGITDLQSGLQQIADGVQAGSIGAGEAKAGVEEIKKNAEKLLSGYQQLAEGYVELETNLSTIHSGYEAIGDELAALNDQLDALQDAFTYVEGYLHGQPISEQQQIAVTSFGYIQQFYNGLKEGLPTLQDSYNQLTAGLGAALDGLNYANEQFSAANAGYEQLVGAFQQLIEGLDQLQSGLEQAAGGQNEIIGHFPDVTDGLGSVNEGQQQLLAGFSSIDEQFGQLTDGLDQGVDGLTQIYDGFTEAEGFLEGLAQSDESAGIYIPEEIFEMEEFELVLETYLSPDKKIATIDVLLDENPYSMDAIANIDELSEAVDRAVKDTKLENAHVEVAGVTSTYNDLSTISDQDFSRTVILMLIGIGIVLIVLFKSLVMPIYLIASLAVTYFTTMGFTEFIFVNLLGYEGLNWAVPFFSFVILMALGVDYSIFLMGRFNEYRGESVDKAMIVAMSKMGTVIISAVIILGGTFAAMMPSGVLSLLQIATVVITGLVLYSIVMLPLFVPVMVKIFGKANWWPFTEQNKE